MQYWLWIQCLIVLGYFVLTVLFWGGMVILFLSMATVPLFIFFRLEHIAMARGFVTNSDVRKIATSLLWIGILLAVLPYVLTEIYWHTKETFFGPGRTHLFWEFGRIAFAVTGVSLAWVTRIVVRPRHEGAPKLISSFTSVVVETRPTLWPLKLYCLAILAMFLTLGLAFGVAALLLIFGGYTSAEIWDEPSYTLQYTMLVGGFLLSLVPVYYMTCLWWRKVALATALASDDDG